MKFLLTIMDFYCNMYSSVIFFKVIVSEEITEVLELWKFNEIVFT